MFRSAQRARTRSSSRWAVGRKEALGRPILYGTTEIFLRTFGLDSLEDLPQLPEEVLDGRGEDPEPLFD